MLPSVALLSLLSFSLVCLHHISPASGGLFDNPESYTNASTYCIACYGESHPSKSKSTDVKSCSELRFIIRGMRKLFADTKKYKGKKKKKEEELTMERIFKDFGKTCPPGETDCFTTYSTDKRIVGFESMGCGGGPPEVPAEPREPCQTGYIRFGGKNQELETCVCENKLLNRDKTGKLKDKDKKKERKMPHAYCNYEYVIKQGGSISVGSPMLLTMMAAFGTILRTVLILI